MTRPVLVLVTGSRALARHTEARAWLRERLDAAAPAGVVCGDAAGPDAWAWGWANERAVVRRRYGLDGLALNAKPGASWVRPWAVAGERTLVPAKRWPLVRNAAMVRDVAALAERYDVRVVGLTCPQSATQGTGHTLRLAREAGLAVVTETFTLTEPR